ncbi:MAG: aldo/keto reductase [Verrucomicrobiota bacterium]
MPTPSAKLELPRIIFGSSALGNLYEVVPDENKLKIVENWIRYQKNPLIDSAGKYGAGLALENIGKCLKTLGVRPDEVLISNKLGWKRTPLLTPEPTFEQGVWLGLENDAAHSFGYDGILACYEQGNELLGSYNAQLLSVHDPDEYLLGADSPEETTERYQDILDSYRALNELREEGKALGVGVGSKDWTIIKRLYDDGVPLDWVMFANSFTIYSHPSEIIDFIKKLNEAGVTIINSAVFNAGFLIGGKWFNYREVTPDSEPELFEWRDRFLKLCEAHSVPPALACCEFGLSAPGIQSLALNTTRAERVEQNVSLVNNQAPLSFWAEMKNQGLIESDYPYL